MVCNQIIFELLNSCLVLVDINIKISKEEAFSFSLKVVRYSSDESWELDLT